MELPDEVCFRFAGQFDGEEDGKPDLYGYQVQYEINDAIVNLVVMSSEIPDSGSTNIEDLLTSKLQEADDDADYEELDRIDQANEEVQREMEVACYSTLLEIVETTNPRKKPSNPTLYQRFHPEVINIELKTVDGKSTVVRHGDIPPWPSALNLKHPFGIEVKLKEDKRILSYRAREVEVVEDHAVPVVSVNGRTFRCKLNWKEEVTQREHDVYLKLSTACLNNVRIPSFHGYVKEGPDTGVIGLLIENIETKYSSLSEAIGESGHFPSGTEPLLRSLETRRKWAKQIEDAVRALHDNDIIWGDVKPDNVVIDINDNAWLIDFGGGISVPFKFPGEEETMEGDNNAVKKLVHYLETGKMPEMPKEGNLDEDSNGDDDDGGGKVDEGSEENDDDTVPNGQSHEQHTRSASGNNEHNQDLVRSLGKRKQRSFDEDSAHENPH